MIPERVERVCAPRERGQGACSRGEGTEYMLLGTLSHSQTKKQGVADIWRPVHPHPPSPTLE